MTLPGSAHPFRSTRLLHLSALRYARRHAWQSGLSFIGIMLGVMMVVAIDLANNSARQSLDIAMNQVTGTISHQIVGGSAGVPNDIYTRLRTELGIRRSAPTISGEISVAGQPFTLLGLDAISEMSLQRQRAGPGMAAGNATDSRVLAPLVDENRVLMSATAARAAGFRDGQALTLSIEGSRSGTVRHIDVELLVIAGDSGAAVATEGVMYADIGLAQRLLRSQGALNTVDSIDLILDAGLAGEVRAWLPAGLTLVEAGSRNDSLEHMRAAFHVNLLAMSLLSLLVASLLIYNTVTLSVLRRYRTLGILRAQGVSRSQLFRLILGEAGILGVTASIAGVLLGFPLGSLLLDLVTQGLPAPGFETRVSTFLVNPWSPVAGFVLGLGMTLLSAALPAWQAAHIAPVTLQYGPARDWRWHRYLLPLSLAGMGMMLSGLVLLMPESSSLVAGFVALTLLIFGFCFLVPGIMVLVLRGLLSLPGRRLAARMALRGVLAGIQRTGLAVAALTVAISVSIGVGIMVDSFRSTVEVWLAQSFNADIEITGEGLDGGLQETLARLPGVSRVAAILDREIESAYGPLRLQVSDQPAADSHYLQEASVAQLAGHDSGEGILISEPLAWQRQLAPGDELTLMTDSGAESLPILGIFHDYTPGLGMVGMHQRLYRQLWDTHEPTRLSVSGDGTASPEELMETVRRVLEDEPQLRAFPNELIREMTLAIFDRTFAITGVLRILAIVIAFIGVLSALMALLLERSREFAMLRATGMTPRQIRGLVLGQTGIMGLFAGLLSLPLGMMMSDVLIDVINKRSFGWSMQHTLPLPVLADALLLALAAALIAGLYPAMRAASINPAVALREE